ncbi:MAG: hypothetical protein LBG68_04275, partial [Coriobacteriales bacterium]|nr:hypothetical protein [Coriobacteriales bacterium]
MKRRIVLEAIQIRGAREHNLKNISLDIPRDQLVVITGLSGSGKSSLAFDTIYAEGQRRYVESLSAYARQFLGQMDKPDLDSIDGLSPAVSIDQRTTSKNPRSTVGTVTEIYDYLRLLFARIGIPHCYECGREINRQTTDQVVDQILFEYADRRVLVLSPVVSGRKGEYGRLFADLQKEGFARVRVDGEVRELGEPIVLNKQYKHDIDVIVDRLVVRPEARSRLAEAIETATKLAEGNVRVQVADPVAAPTAEQPTPGQPGIEQLGIEQPGTEQLGIERPGTEQLDAERPGTERQPVAQPTPELAFSLALACPEHGHSMDDLAPRDFSFNAPYGACPECAGLGYKREVDEALIIPDPSLSLADGAFVVARSSNYYPQVLAAVAKHIGVDIDTPWSELSLEARNVFLYGLANQQIRLDYTTRDGRDTYWHINYSGLIKITNDRYNESSSEAVRAKMEEFFSTKPCSTCNGARLKPEILAVTVGELNIHQVTRFSARESLVFFEGLHLNTREQMIGGRVIKEVVERLRF